MPIWLEIAKGPVFYFALAIFLLGLARLIFLAIWGMVAAIRRAGNRRVPYVRVLTETLGWLVPFYHLPRKRPVYGIATFILHLGVILAALFLQNHIEVWWSSAGITWPALPRLVLDILTILTIIAGIYLVLYRLYSHRGRGQSTLMDYILLLLLLSICISGYIAGRPGSPIPYNSLMLFHTLSGIVLIVLIPFTKIAHCILYPLLKLAAEIAWHLTPQGGTDAIKTLYGPEGRKL